MRLKTRLILFFLLGTLITFSQSEDYKLPQVIPSSPNTASLGKYGEIPVGLFTGSPQISIPLCELKAKNISVPVILRYNSNGVRVDEYSSNVGMGWDLSVGGVVTRQVNDDPDENPQKVMPDFPAQLITVPMENFLVSQTNETGNGTPGSSDYQPDVYSFNFGGYSGKFYLDNNSTFISERTPVLLEPAPLKIKLNTGGGNLNGFIITDPNGIKYTFNTTEKSMNRSSCVELPFDVLNYKITNAWHLTSIVYPNGYKTQFTYNSKEVSFKNGVSQSITAETNVNNSGCNIPINTACLYNTTNTTPYLTEINVYTNDNESLGKIAFSYSHKSGMPSNMDKLDKVLLFDTNSKLIKEQVLEYQSYEASKGNSLHSLLQQDYYKKRFYLIKVTEKDSTGLSKPSHKFDYNDPEDLPSRFSFSQDFWGYYNGRQNTNLISSKTIEPFLGNISISSSLSYFQAANRSASFYNGIKGSLKKVTYPTGGSNILYYEGHSYSGPETIYPPITTQTARAEHYDEYAEDEFTTIMIPFDQDADLSFALSSVGGPIEEGLGGSSSNPNPLNFIVEVKDLTEDQNVTIYQRINNAGWPITNPFGVTIDNYRDNYYVNLKKDHTYSVKVMVSQENTIGAASLSFYTTRPVIEITNKEVGGLRIAKVETDDGNGNIQTKNYHYATLKNLSLSSGNLTSGNFTAKVSQFSMATGGHNQCQTITFSSNSAYPVYGVYHIGYKSIIEEYGENFSEGGIINTFQTQRRGFELSEGFGTYIQGTPQSNFFGYGRPWEKIVFRKEGSNYVTLSKETNVYKYDPYFDKEIQAYNVRMSKNIGSNVATSLESRIGQYDISGYKKKRQWHYLEKSIDSIFDEDGLNPVVTTKEYFYDNPDHLQLTSTKTTVSDDASIITRTYYADDVTSTSSLSNDALTPSEKSAIDQLKVKHRISEPIQTEVYKDFDNNGIAGNDELISVQRTNYINANNPLPREIQSLKGVYNSTTNSLENRIVFHDYDAKGNPIEVSKSDGTHIYYVWGYNEKYPIAKLEHFTAADITGVVQNLIDTAVNASNADVDATTEAALSQALANLQDDPSTVKAQVTYYTYDPLIGVTSMTDPRGYTMYYEYDAFNRLQVVKDTEGNILSKNEYHYKDQLQQP